MMPVCLRTTIMKKFLKPIIILSVSLILISIAIAIWGMYSFGNGFWSDISYKHRYIECRSEELLPDLERIFDINFPAEIKQVDTARTQGTWDSTNSGYIVKFAAKPDTVNKFLDSFPEKIYFEPYDLGDDQRGSHWKPPPPRWFTEPIREGRSGTYRLANPSMRIYIDTTDKSELVVYLHGIYHRTLED